MHGIPDVVFWLAIFAQRYSSSVGVTLKVLIFTSTNLRSSQGAEEEQWIEDATLYVDVPVKFCQVMSERCS